MRSIAALVSACALSTAASTARAQPRIETNLVATVQRWATQARLCDAIAQSRQVPTWDRRTCMASTELRTLRWQAAGVDRGIHYVHGHTNGESFWMFRVGVDRRGRIVSARAAYSRGGP